MTKPFSASIAQVNATTATLAIQFTTAIPGATVKRNIAETPGGFDTLEGTTPDGFKFTYDHRVAAPGTEADALTVDPENGFAVNPYTIVTRKGVDPVEYAGVNLREALIQAGVAGAQPSKAERDALEVNKLLARLSASGISTLSLDDLIRDLDDGHSNSDGDPDGDEGLC